MESNAIDYGIAGFNRPLYYQDEAKSLLATHQQLVEKYQICLPYFNQTDRGLPYILEAGLGHGLTLLIGEIGAFTAGQMALIMNEQPQEYLIEGTMGRFPKECAVANQELIAQMAGGYTRERVVVSITQEKDGVSTPVAGVQAQPGLDYITIARGLSDETGLASTLSPSRSLYPVGDALSTENYINFIAEFGEKNESVAVTMSRLFKRGDALLQEMDISPAGLSTLCMASLAIAISNANYTSGIKPEIVYYDTHLPPLQSMLQNVFDMTLIANHGNLMPTKAVQDSVLRYHYTSSDQGGFMSSIVLGAGKVESYTEKSEAYLKRKWNVTI